MEEIKMAKQNGSAQSATQGVAGKAGARTASFAEKLTMSWGVKVQILVPESSKTPALESKSK
jgi:hypothetical protein